MTSYLLRAIDSALWTRVKARAAADGLPLRTILLALVSAYAAGSLDLAAVSVTERKDS